MWICSLFGWLKLAGPCFIFWRTLGLRLGERIRYRQPQCLCKGLRHGKRCQVNLAYPIIMSWILSLETLNFTDICRFHVGRCTGNSRRTVAFCSRKSKHLSPTKWLVTQGPAMQFFVFKKKVKKVCFWVVVRFFSFDFYPFFAIIFYVLII